MRYAEWHWTDILFNENERESEREPQAKSTQRHNLIVKFLQMQMKNFYRKI